MVSEFSVELLAVWMAIDDYKNTASREERLEKLSTIQRRFLVRGAPEEINITSELRDATLLAIKTALSNVGIELENIQPDERQMLDRLQVQVENMIAGDTLQRFKKATIL